MVRNGKGNTWKDDAAAAAGGGGVRKEEKGNVLYCVDVSIFTCIILRSIHCMMQ
jgi:hypothetical protein